MWYRRTARLALIFAFIHCHIAGAIARPASAASNSTGDGDISDSHLYCEKTAWYDVCWFFFTNYLLHALSVRSLPGENAYSSTVFKLCCLLVPYTGVRRGLSLISRASSLTRNDLQAAARAGALCMVIRKPDWRPEDGQTVSGCRVKIGNYCKIEGLESASFDEKKEEFKMSVLEKSRTDLTVCDNDTNKRSQISLNVEDCFEPPPPSGVLERVSKILIQSDRFNNDMPSCSPVDHESTKIHGFCKLAPGYGLSYVSPNVKIYARQNSPSEDRRIKSTRLASTHDIPRILFSCIQTVSGGYSLYKARGSQIDRYGYAAFGLTVLPYMIVSIINFLGSLLSAEYETIYMVHSATMDEMVSRGGIVDGVVGSLHQSPPDEELPTSASDEPTGPDYTSISFTGPPDYLCGYEEKLDQGHGRNFIISPYQPPKPSPSKRWLIRMCKRYRRWHGLVTGFEPNRKLPPPDSAINIPTHSPIDHFPSPTYQNHLNLFAIILLALTVSLPYVVISFLTGWKGNESTQVQRNFVLTWLICGQMQGYAVAKVERLTGKKNSIRGLLVIFIFYGSNCLCGLTIVAQEMLEFGTCKAV